MNWIKQNPFIAGLIGITVVLVGAFGFLLFQKQSAFADASEQFTSQAKEAARLQELKPYPDKANLQKATAEKESFRTKVEDLQKQLVSFNLPMVQISVTEFVEKLRDLNAKTEEAAGRENVKLPENFYMGFEKYQTSPPNSNATSRMNQQLEAISTVLNLLIQQSNLEIKTLKRDEIPEEGTGTSPTGLVTKTRFMIEFRADQEKGRTILGKIVAMEKPFLVIRNIRILNDVVDTIPRTPAGGAAAAGAPPAGAQPPPDPNQENPLPENPPAPPSPIEIITGMEKVLFSLELEVVTFGEGQAQAPATGPASKNQQQGGGAKPRR